MINKKEHSFPTIIGANTFITVEGISGVPAKVDTGADSSSIHALDIHMTDNNILFFRLISNENTLISTRDYRVSVVRSSNGDEEIRYRVPLSIILGGKRIRATFTLSDRSKNNFPVLIGRRTLKGKFLVDVSKKEIYTEKHPSTKHLNEELKKDPKKFHDKYIRKEKK